MFKKRDYSEMLVWLGIRESDISNTGSLFDGSVTIFGSNKNNNISMEGVLGHRINHNGECPGYDEFYRSTITKLIGEYPEVRFLQYDALDFKDFPKEMQKHFVYLNDYALLEKLNHKHALKHFFSKVVDVLPHLVKKWGDVSFEELKEMFPGRSSFVLQKDFSCGGSGTFLFKQADDSGFHDGILQNEELMVTPYMADNISVNVHCVIYEEEVVFFPPSIQLVDQKHTNLEYLGSDFSAFKGVSVDEKVKVRETALKIAELLQKRGYRGVCGIDLILADDRCYFMEINSRFQASTSLLNRYLSKQGIPSLVEYHIDAFVNNRCSFEYPGETAEGSCYTVHYQSADANRLKWFYEAVDKAKGFELIEDNFSESHDYEEGCYAFQIYKDTAISCVTFQHQVRIHPCVNYPRFNLTGKQEYENLLKLKILALARGVQIDKSAWDLAAVSGGVDWYEFEAVTFKLPCGIWITAPCMDEWHELSPLVLKGDVLDRKFYLTYYWDVLCEVEVLPEDSVSVLKSKGGHFIRDLVYLNPDRLRVYHRDGCIFQDAGKGCKFCDLFGTGTPITVEEIKEALDLYWDNPRIDHYMIGGGSDSQSLEYESVRTIAGYIHSKCDKHIYLMSLPYNSTEKLSGLRDCGITEVGFNLEIFDSAIAEAVMPGKAGHSLSYYMESLKKAAEVFGKSGEVRSAVVVGFDDFDTFCSGIRKVCEAGAAPILSLYRMGKETALANYMPLDEYEAFKFFCAAQSICKEYSLRLGPSCKPCQNNTLALDL